MMSSIVPLFDVSKTSLHYVRFLTKVLNNLSCHVKNCIRMVDRVPLVSTSVVVMLPSRFRQGDDYARVRQRV